MTVSSELELLSLLSTSDIKAIGGEVLSTWGGPALAGITHPQVPGLQTGCARGLLFYLVCT